MFMFVKDVTVRETNKTEEAPKVCPKFKPRFWHRYGRLDARPVVWSLLNKPEEWELKRFTLFHKPSNHYYSMSYPYRVEHRSHCDCSLSDFQFGQTLSIGKAMKAWKEWNSRRINDQFHSHF